MTSRTLFAPLLLLFLATGCRLYGGYDAKELTLREIAIANERFEEELLQIMEYLKSIGRKEGGGQ